MKMDVHGRMQRIVAVLVFISGAYGSSVSFGTVSVYGSDFNLSVPDNSRVAEAVIDIEDRHIIYDADAVINITRTNIFDLQIFLQGPGGTRASLNEYATFNDFFEGTNYVQTVFDDEAAISVKPGDTFYGDTGALDSCELMTTNPEPATALLMVVGIFLMFFHRRQNH